MTTVGFGDSGTPYTADGRLADVDGVDDVGAAATGAGDIMSGPAPTSTTSAATAVRTRELSTPVRRSAAHRGSCWAGREVLFGLRRRPA